MGIFLRFLNCVNGTKHTKLHTNCIIVNVYSQNAINGMLWKIFTGESIYFYNSKTVFTFFIYSLKSFINCDSKRKMWVPRRSVDFRQLFLAFRKVSLYWSCAKLMFKYEFWWFVYSSIYLFIYLFINIFTVGLQS